MAENDDAQEKTEEPSQRKLTKAREDGDVLNSKEMFVFATSSILLTLVPFTSWFGIDAMKSLAYFFSFEQIDNGLLISRLSVSFTDVLFAAIIFGIPVVCVVLATQMLVGGMIGFSVKGFSFKGNRINPLSGFKRIFSVKGLVELLKSIAKVVFLAGVAFVTLALFFNDMLNVLGSSIPKVFEFFNGIYLFLVTALLVILGIIAAVDYAYSRYSRLNKLKMSRQEMKDENKETDGSPEVKSRIRRLQMEASQRAREHLESIDNITDATALITNPTHFAVAIKFIPGEMSAPTIVSMGRGKLAETLISRASDSDLVVFTSPVLARALYFTSNVGQDIDSRLFAGVAAVLAYIFRLEQGQNVTYPSVEVPSDMRFNEFGRPME
jgi:flagellar biosynthetic protein FlhB